MKKWCFLALFAFYGCMSPTEKTGGEGTENGKRPGGISLTRLSGLAKTGRAVADSFPAVINLDTAISSYNQYFILQNTGDEPVKNIVITTANPNLVFKPSQIPLLEPQGKLNLVQVLRLAVTHGKRLEGFGYDSLLKMGANVSPSSIKGATVDGSGAALSVEYKFDLSVFAKVMDVRAYAGTQEIDLADVPWHVTPPNYTVGDPGSLPDYEVGADSVKLVNAGNADIVLGLSVDNPDKTTSTSTRKFPAGSSLSVKTPVTLELDGGGVAVDPARINLAPNGKAYMAFNLGGGAPADSLPHGK